MASQKNNSLFAMLFSDLMMGAMAVIIVLLVFLQVVKIRGAGEFDAERELEFPPGLDMNTFPVVRVRLEYCTSNPAKGTEKALTRMDWNGATDAVREYVMRGKIGDVVCEYRIFHFEDGLGGNSIDLHSVQSNNAAVTEVNIHVTVAGYTLPRKNFSRYSRSSSLIATIDLDKQEVIDGA